jgi:hypothetical protein
MTCLCRHGGELELWLLPITSPTLEGVSRHHDPAALPLGNPPYHLHNTRTDERHVHFPSTEFHCIALSRVEIDT